MVPKLPHPTVIELNLLDTKSPQVRTSHWRDQIVCAWIRSSEKGMGFLFIV